MEERIPAYTFTEENKTYLRLFFPKTGKSNQALSPILSRKDMIEKSSYYSALHLCNCSRIVGYYVSKEWIISGDWD